VRFTKYEYDDQLKGDEMGGACSTHEMRHAYRILVGRPEG